MNKVYLLFGSNLGDAITNIRMASKLIAETIGTIERSSAYYETAAWGNEQQPAFLNQVVLVSTTLDPLVLLQALLKIETKLGRQRTALKWQERTIDIDILFYNDALITEAELVVPHPYLHERRFTLIPLAEIAPQLQHPVFKKNIEQLLLTCTDKLNVIKK